MLNEKVECGSRFRALWRSGIYLNSGELFHCRSESLGFNLGAALKEKKKKKRNPSREEAKKNIWFHCFHHTPPRTIYFLSEARGISSLNIYLLSFFLRACLHCSHHTDLCCRHTCLTFDLIHPTYPGSNIRLIKPRSSSYSMRLGQPVATTGNTLQALRPCSVLHHRPCSENRDQLALLGMAVGLGEISQPHRSLMAFWNGAMSAVSLPPHLPVNPDKQWLCCLHSERRSSPKWASWPDLKAGPALSRSWSKDSWVPFQTELSCEPSVPAQRCSSSWRARSQ